MDSATISRLFNENSVWMKRLALSLLRDEGWADDVVQETWLELVERPPARSDSLLNLHTFKSFRESSYPGAGRPYSLAVTRASATTWRQRNVGRVAANSSLAVR